MLPVIALIGRPNVGKSTIFNQLTRRRDAIVADTPGVTRDRQYGQGQIGESAFLVIDTGGIIDSARGMDKNMLAQTHAAIAEADLLFFIVDAKAGLQANDQQIAELLRHSHKPITLVVNKIDGVNVELDCADFFQLGFVNICYISAAHNRGISDLISLTFADIETPVPVPESHDGVIKVAVIGKPNVGKSTLINRILGEERVVVYDQPGTTRDSIFIPFTKNQQEYILIDTAGVRRRGRITDALEKFSVIKTLQALQQAHVAILLFNARDGITEQDLKMLGHVLDAGKSFILAMNQWDGLSEHERKHIKSEIDRRLSFIVYAKLHFISALHGSGVGLLLDAVNEVYQSAMTPLQSSYLTKILQNAVERSPPPIAKGRRIKLRFAHPMKQNPPTIKIHGTQTSRLPGFYQRYLTNFFREALQLVGTPVVLHFADSENPFKDQHNKPTVRQIRKKRRLMKHVKKRK